MQSLITEINQAEVKRCPFPTGIMKISFLHLVANLLKIFQFVGKNKLRQNSFHRGMLTKVAKKRQWVDQKTLGHPVDNPPRIVLSYYIHGTKDPSSQHQDIPLAPVQSTPFDGEV